MTLRRLSGPGIERYSDYLDQLAADPSAAAPEGILSDPSYSEVVEPRRSVDVHRTFPRRFEAGEYLTGLLEGVNAARDVGLWCWLALAYLDQACPQGPEGRRCGERARMFPEVSNYQKRYRHLLLGPYLIYQAHRFNPAGALGLLFNPVNTPGEVAEQLSSKVEVVGSAGLVELATQLYYDPRRARGKVGSGNRDGPGIPRRLMKILGQFELTWDVAGMPWQAVAEKLPPEFDRWLPARRANP